MAMQPHSSSMGYAPVIDQPQDNSFNAAYIQAMLARTNEGREMLGALAEKEREAKATALALDHNTRALFAKTQAWAARLTAWGFRFSLMAAGVPLRFTEAEREDGMTALAVADIDVGDGNGNGNGAADDDGNGACEGALSDSVCALGAEADAFLRQHIGAARPHRA